MSAEHEASGQPFYDHERDPSSGVGGRRRRIAVADWGVSEDVFDRMPGPRFAHKRRSTSQTIVIERGADVGAARVVDVDDEDARQVDDWLQPESRRHGDGADWSQPESRRHGDGADWSQLELRRGGDGSEAQRQRGDADWRESEAEADERVVADWLADAAPASAPRASASADAPRERPVADWFAPPAATSRTIVIERDDAGAAYADIAAAMPASAPEPTPAGAPEPAGRRTVVIAGRPGERQLPLPRARRPRTAIDRLGPSPDRIVAYAVGLGVLLILIAILTSH